jgi:1,4-alpha-glucan branching enzyme
MPIQFDLDGLRGAIRARAVIQEENKAIILDPRDFRWGTADGWKMPPKEDLVMYEMHLGTFAPTSRAAARPSSGRRSACPT